MTRRSDLEIEEFAGSQAPHFEDNRQQPKMLISDGLSQGSWFGCCGQACFAPQFQQR
jgi:hypothetical protein